MNINVFLGPSLAQDEARALLPGATFCPPAQQGDLLASVNLRGATVIGLIDGTFHQNLSVWHNEVCYLLSRGITIFGASSMGALRAAETDRFGMVGVGEIYRWYRDGVITADDEVALLHGDEAAGYQPLSLPLVNIRASMRQAVAQDRLRSADATKLIEIAREIYYPERQVDAILNACSSAGLSEPAIAAARRALVEDYEDLKKADARELLLALRRLRDGTDQPPQPKTFKFARSSVFEYLYNLDQKVETEHGEVTLQQVGEFFALHSPDFPEIRRASLDRAVVGFFAHLIGIAVTPAEMATQHADFARQRGLKTSDDLARWLKKNLFTPSDLDEYLAQEASCRRLRAWAMSSGNLDRGAKALIDELRMRGLFPHWANATADQAAIVETWENAPEYRAIEDIDPALLAQRHAENTGVRIEGDARAWATHAGFEEVSDVVDAIRRSVIAHDVTARIARQVQAFEQALAAQA